MYTQKSAEYSVIVWAGIIISVVLILFVSHGNVEFVAAFAHTQALIGVLSTVTMLAFGLLGDLLRICKIA